MQEGALKNTGVIKNGEFKPYEPVKAKKAEAHFEGKVVDRYFIEHEEHHSDEARGYYYGGIIRGTCMKTEKFGGWEAQEIDSYFHDMFLNTEVFKTLGDKTVVVPVRGSIAKLGKRKMREFIDKVLNYLAMEEIYPLSPEEFYHKHSAYIHVDTTKKRT